MPTPTAWAKSHGDAVHIDSWNRAILPTLQQGARTVTQTEVKRGGGRGAPYHVAIIMDGNGRWAAQRGLPRGEGHRRGVEAVRKTVRAADELGIGILTIFSFSSENWTRPRSEILDLMALLRRF